jgi:hypothetical protein
VSDIYCDGGGTLVSGQYWLPSEPFDHVWGMFGCNQLRCGSCKQLVRSRMIEAGSSGRLYECRCQSREEYRCEALDDILEGPTQQPFWTHWRCAGHPKLEFPIVLDGIELSAIGPYGEIVKRTLASPPFIAPGFSRPSFWVERLFHLMPTESQKANVSRPVGCELSNDDPRIASAAMEFFCALPAAAGAEKLAEVATSDEKRLRTAADPRRPSSTLYERILEAIEARIYMVPNGPVDSGALEVAHQVLLGGEASIGMLISVASRDQSWFSESVAAIVGANPELLSSVVRSLKHLSEDQQLKALAALRGLNAEADVAARKWMLEHQLSLE